MPPVSPRLAPGTLVDDKWRVDGVLGEGGMGTVYAATHTRNGRAVALKVLHEDVARDEVIRKRFLHEGYAANRVRHPGAVQVLDDGVSRDGLVYLVMERLEGRPLDAVAERAGGKLPAQETLGYAIGWLEVIAAAHAVGIIHRDLKPENVMLLVDGSIKVLDFGLARVREVTSKARLTISSAPMGTPAFMPPEQALARWDDVDSRSDVYALGASLFTLLTGHLVHEATTMPELMVRVCTQQVRPVRSLDPSIPIPLARVVDRALSFQREQRHADGRAMLLDLKRAAAEMAAAGPRATLQSAGGHDFTEAPTESLTLAELEDAWRSPADVPRVVPHGGPAPHAALQPSAQVPGTHMPSGTLVAGTTPPHAAMLSPRHTADPVSSEPGKATQRRLRLGAVVGLALGLVAAMAIAYAATAQRTSAPTDGTAALSATADPGPPQGTPGGPSVEPASALAASPGGSLRPAASASAAPPAGASPAASASARPRAKTPRASPRTCKKDPFTLKCPCASCP